MLAFGKRSILSNAKNSLAKVLFTMCVVVKFSNKRMTLRQLVRHPSYNGMQASWNIYNMDVSWYSLAYSMSLFGKSLSLFPMSSKPCEFLSPKFPLSCLSNLTPLVFYNSSDLPKSSKTIISISISWSMSIIAHSSLSSNYQTWWFVSVDTPLASFKHNYNTMTWTQVGQVHFQGKNIGK